MQRKDDIWRDRGEGNKYGSSMHPDRKALIVGVKVDPYLESRQKERLESTKIIWAKSPREPSPEASPQPVAPKRAAATDDNDSDSGSRKYTASKHKKSSHKKSKKRRRKPSSSPTSDNHDQFVAVENHEAVSKILNLDGVISASSHPAPQASRTNTYTNGDEDGEESQEFGPSLPQSMAPQILNNSRLTQEGAAMQAFLESGKRIPRRGEIGLTSDEISTYEAQGFVMSGSRHTLMNAVRVKKENQVISQEERKALLVFNQAEKLRKEAEIIGNFRELVAQRIAETDKNDDRK